MNMGTLTLIMQRACWGHLVHVYQIWAITGKRLIIEQKGRIFGHWGRMGYEYGYFSPWTCQGHFGVIRCIFLNVEP